MDPNNEGMQPIQLALLVRGIKRCKLRVTASDIIRISKEYGGIGTDKIFFQDFIDLCVDT